MLYGRFQFLTMQHSKEHFNIAKGQYHFPVDIQSFVISIVLLADIFKRGIFSLIEKSVNGGM